MNVHITSAYADPEPVSTFRDYAALDRFGLHQVTDDPGAADLILFVENSHYEEDSFLRRLAGHPLVARHREKCFMYNEHDRPYCVLPGVYASMPSQYVDRTRQRAWLYLYTRNPFIEEHGRHAGEPDLLFSFAGRRNATVRDEVLGLRDASGAVVDTTDFDAYRYRENRNERAISYATLLGRSRFVLCPRGVGTGTQRVQEVMQSGRVPVILSDAWVAPDGPDWDSFSLRVPEAAVAELPELLRAQDVRWPDMAQAARRAWEEWFAPDVAFHRIVTACVDILHSRRVPESVAQRYPRPLPLYLKYRARALLRPVRRRLDDLRQRAR